MSLEQTIDKRILIIAANDNSHIKAESAFFHAKYGDDYNTRIEYLSDAGYIDVDAVKIPIGDTEGYKLLAITDAGKNYLASI